MIPSPSRVMARTNSSEVIAGGQGSFIGTMLLVMLNIVVPPTGGMVGPPGAVQRSRRKKPTPASDGDASLRIVI